MIYKGDLSKTDTQEVQVNDIRQSDIHNPHLLLAVLSKIGVE